MDEIISIGTDEEVINFPFDENGIVTKEGVIAVNPQEQGFSLAVETTRVSYKMVRGIPRPSRLLVRTQKITNRIGNQWPEALEVASTRPKTVERQMRALETLQGTLPSRANFPPK